MCKLCENEHYGMARRDFIKTGGISVAGISVAGTSLAAGVKMGTDGISNSAAVDKKIPVIRGAFLYPPSGTLEKEGYFSWPGSSFDAEGRQKQYMSRIKEIESKLNIRIEMDQEPLNMASDVDKFLGGLKTTNPDGLLLIPFKKSHWTHVVRIVDEAKIPSIVMATIGVLLIELIWQLRDRAGVYMISSLDDLDAVESGLKMVQTSCWMRDAMIVSIDGSKVVDSTVPVIGTKVRNIPHQRFYDHFANQQADSKVQTLAKQYMKNAVKIVQPTKEDITESAKTYFIYKKILAEENADALMMNCLSGLRKPHKHVPPCMGHLSLRDEGVAVGCEADLDATLTQMLLLKLFDKPGFIQDPAYDTEKDLFFGAHCTSASKMNGIDKPSEPYELMSHCESGWGVSPRVLFKKDQEVTIAKYVSDEKKPQMLIYSGKIVDCPAIPPTGGCRTNVVTTINEVHSASDLKVVPLMHAVMIYGDHVKQLKQFCQLYNIEVIV